MNTSENHINVKVKVKIQVKVKVSPHCKEIVPLCNEHRSSSTQRHLEYADQGKYVQKIFGKHIILFHTYYSALDLDT